MILLYIQCPLFFRVSWRKRCKQPSLTDVIAVGDSNNDSSMIEQAGLSLAVANACDALKELADQTICDHSEHIAKYVLENFIS